MLIPLATHPSCFFGLLVAGGQLGHVSTMITSSHAVSNRRLCFLLVFNMICTSDDR